MTAEKKTPSPIAQAGGVVPFTFAIQIANGLAVRHLLSASHFLVAGSDA